MFFLSPSGISSPSNSPVCFSTSCDSPVNAASCIFRLCTSSKRISAGTICPASNNTLSPGTNSCAGITLIFPSRITVALGAAILRNASTAFSARYSCTKPMMALMITISKIIIVSVTSPMMPDITAAAINTIIIKSWNCFRNFNHIGFFFSRTSSLGPCVINFSSAFACCKPSGLAPSFSKSSC